jgi:hypothetical protein
MHSKSCTYTTEGAQGDVYFRRVSAVPIGYQPIKAMGEVVIAHSESRHNHIVSDDLAVLYEGPDPLVAYLRLASDAPADIIHMRGWDTHGTVSLAGAAGDVWEVRRQREHDPDGDRRAAD